MLAISNFYTFIIPLANVEKYYPGGLAAFMQSDDTREYYRDARLYSFDDYLCVYADMGSGIDGVVEFWKSLGAVDTLEENGEQKFNDFCLIQGSPDRIGKWETGLCLPCDWVVIDSDNLTARHKDDSKI
jgi:hypothetical protein